MQRKRTSTTSFLVYQQQKMSQWNKKNGLLSKQERRAVKNLIGFGDGTSGKEL